MFFAVREGLVMSANFPARLVATLAIAVSSAAEAADVDVAIVFAVDVSASVDRETADLQREGHADALSSPDTLAAIALNPNGCIAVTYIEWSSPGQLRTIVPWTDICGADDVEFVASEIRRNGYRGAGCEFKCSTSISFAIDASNMILDSYAGKASRKIIDISANGVNNDGMSVEVSRSVAIEQGYTINAIAIPETTLGVKEDLFEYFADNVIGGPGAFVIEPTGAGDYGAALRRKLVLEIARSGGNPWETNRNYTLRSVSTDRRQTDLASPTFTAKARYRPVVPRNRAKG
jgi:hypothetical protein